LRPDGERVSLARREQRALDTDLDGYGFTRRTLFGGLSARGAVMKFRVEQARGLVADRHSEPPDEIGSS